MAWSPRNHQLVMFGGMGATGDLDDTWVWNGSEWLKEHPQHSPSARAGASMSADPSTGQLILFGGSFTTVERSSASQTIIGDSWKALTDTWEWNGTDWTQLHSMSFPNMSGYVMGTAMTTDPHLHQLILFVTPSDGGAPADDTQNRWAPGVIGPVSHVCCADAPSPQEWVWTGTDWRLARTVKTNISVVSTDQKSASILGFTTPTDGYPACTLTDISDLSPAYLASPGIETPAASNSCTVQGQTLFWNGSSWIQLHTAVGPPDLPFAAMATIPQSTVIMVDSVGNTWLWGDPTWQRLSTANVGRRAWASVASDPDTSQVVLFGGYANHSQLSDTWTFDGKSWSLKTT
jgi:hypothetical protein